MTDTKPTCFVDLYEDNIVFTTTDKATAAILELVCDDANITESDEEYHYQGWVKKK